MTPDLKELEALLEKAPKGPFVAFGADGKFWVLPAMDPGEVCAISPKIPPAAAGALADLFAAIPRLAPALLASASRAERLEADNERLRLAILGGEDAPGYAASLGLETVIGIHNDNVATTRWRVEKAEARVAELTELSAELADAADGATCGLADLLDGFGYHDEEGVLPRADAAIKAIRQALESTHD